jgi:arginine/lysine/ornithine decarboxylase
MDHHRAPVLEALVKYRSLSVKPAMFAVAGPGEKILPSLSAYKSDVSGFLIAGVNPVFPAAADPKMETFRVVAR